VREDGTSFVYHTGIIFLFFISILLLFCLVWNLIMSVHVSHVGLGIYGRLRVQVIRVAYSSRAVCERED
jgi:hypothetical protein